MSFSGKPLPPQARRGSLGLGSKWVRFFEWLRVDARLRCHTRGEIHRATGVALSKGRNSFVFVGGFVQNGFVFFE
jgi:hypothetical protein